MCHRNCSLYLSVSSIREKGVSHVCHLKNYFVLDIRSFFLVSQGYLLPQMYDHFQCSYCNMGFLLNGFYIPSIMKTCPPLPTHPTLTEHQLYARSCVRCLEYKINKIIFCVYKYMCLSTQFLCIEDAKVSTQNFILNSFSMYQGISLQFLGGI